MSGLTELPSTAPSSLGPDKVDRIVYMNEAYRTQAFLINKMRTYLIQMGEMLGLGDASTPGSLAYRVNALELASASPATIRSTGAGQQVITSTSETVIGAFGAFAPATYSSPIVEWEATAIFAPATAGSAEIRLYDVGTRAAPTAGTLRATISVPVFDVGVRKCVAQTLTATPTPGINTSTIFDSERVYELRAILIGTTPGDALTVENVSLLVTGTVLGGTFAPTAADYLTLSPTAALTSERLLTPQKSLSGIDGGPGSTYGVELVGDTAAPGANKVYGTDAFGARGWQTSPGNALLEWNGVDTTQFDPVILYGGATGGSVSAVDSPVLPGLKVLRVQLNAGTPDLGGALFLFSTPLPYSSIRTRFSYGLDSAPGTPPAAPDVVAVGLTYASNAAGTHAFATQVVIDPGGALETIEVGYRDPGGAGGNTAGGLPSSYARYVDSDFLGTLVPFGVGDAPVLFGRATTHGMPAASGSGAIGVWMNPVGFAYDISWESVDKDRVGIVITNRSGAALNADCTVLLFGVGFEPALVGRIP